MPAQGAAILSQIEGLLEQLTELDYDTPAKEWASQLMPEVSQMADQLRSQASEGMPAEEGYSETPRQGPKQFSNFDDAKAAVKTDMVNDEGRFKAFAEDEEETDDAELRRRRKAKAPVGTARR